MSNFFKNLLIKEEVTPKGESKQEVVTPQVTNQTPTPQVQTTIQTPTPTTPISTGQPTPTPSTDNGMGKYLEMLENVITENNQPGLDYLEFKDAVANLESIQMDEVTKFKSTYSILKTQGCTKGVILASIDKYIELVENEEKNFNEDMTSRIASTVTSKRNEVENTKAEIDSLNQRISELNTRILELNQEANTEEIQLKLVETNFKQSVKKIVDVLTSDKNKITTYITE